MLRYKNAENVIANFYKQIKTMTNTVKFKAGAWDTKMDENLED